MKTVPATVRKFASKIIDHGWEKPKIERDDEGTFTWRYDDGSARTFEQVESWTVAVSYAGPEGDVLVVTYWIRNPVTGRLVLCQTPGQIIRVRRDDEFPNDVTRRLNRQLGTDGLHWAAPSLRRIVRLIESGPVAAARTVARWKP